MLKKLKLNSPIYITRRMGISKLNAWLIRAGGILAAFLLSGILCTIISPGTFGMYFKLLFEGNFSQVDYIFDLLCCISTYLLLSIAVAPAFKMKFWNIGAEGQAIVGTIVTAVILLLFPQSIPGPVVIIFALVASIAAGMLWAFIPTICKIKFNANETLFTLMMNYIAIALGGMTVAFCAKGGSQQFPNITDSSRLIINIGETRYIPFIAIAIILTVLMYFYLTKTKHGFELSVMGDSRNTARYTGMSITKITIRTMLISGAIAGLVGFLLVCGQHKTLSENLVNGKGFTGVLIAWLGHFNPAEIGLYSFLIGFIDQGVTYAAGDVKVPTSYFSGLMIGLFIFVVVVTEFFVSYQIKIRKKEAVSIKNDNSDKKQINVKKKEAK